MPNTIFRKALTGLICGLTCGLLPACVARQPEPGQPPHHRGNGFQNNYVEFEPRSMLDLLRWKWDAARDGLPQPPQQPTPAVRPDLDFLQANGRAGAAMQPSATWIGHATVLAQLGGLNVITDPVFSERASPVSWAGPKRAQPPGLALAELPHIDAVLISHNHYDHCDVPSLLALNAQAGGPPLFVVPLGVRAWLADLGIRNAIELDWWQQHTLRGVDIVFTPAQHWSARGLTDRLATLWGGYALFAPDFQLFFAGDTGYSPDFKDIHQRFAARQRSAGFDLALLPIGAYAPRWFMQQQHVDPDESVRIHLDLAAKQSIGVHWGTFQLTDEPLDEPPRQLALARQRQHLRDDAFTVLAVGETRKLPPRMQGQ